MLLLILILFFALAYLASLLSGRGPIFIRETGRTRRAERSASDRRSAQRESELLRERIIGGAMVIAAHDIQGESQEVAA